jgi:hypothetical protein
MAHKRIGPGVSGITRRAGESFSRQSSNPQIRLTASPRQTPRYVRWPVYNDDRHLVGHELLKIGPDLDHFIRRMAEEAK